MGKRIFKLTSAFCLLLLSYSCASTTLQKTAFSEKELLLAQVVKNYEQKNFSAEAQEKVAELERLILPLKKKKKQLKKEVRGLQVLADTYCYFAYQTLLWREFGAMEFQKMFSLYSRKAKQFGRSAVHADAEDFQSWRAMGNYYLLQNQKWKARSYLREALQLQKSKRIKDTETYYLMAWAMNRNPADILDPKSRSYSFFKIALRSDPPFLWALQDQFMAYLQTQQLPKAKASLEELQKYYSLQNETPYYQGMYFLMNGQDQKAKALFQLYADNNPSAPVSRFLVEVQKSMPVKTLSSQ